MAKLIRPKSYAEKPLSLKDFYKRRNTVLIWHEKGGLGDVFMQRMMIEDIKKTVGNCKLVFACLPEYIDAVKDHPFLSEVIDSRPVNPKEYMACYNTCVTIADRYENQNAPSKEHRSDIWAANFGLTLSSHEMHINLNQDLAKRTKDKIEKLRKPGTKLVAFAPVSKMSTKSLLPNQLKAVIDAAENCTLVGLHTKEIKELTSLGVSGIYGSTIPEWMGYINAADYVISVDTAAFHLAGGLKKPLMGIFTFADGKAYGKYFDFVLVQKHRDDGNWDCGPCFKFNDCPKCKTLPKPCLTEIDETMLKNGVKEMLGRRTNLPILI